MKQVFFLLMLLSISVVYSQEDPVDTLEKSECIYFPDKEAEFPGGFSALQVYISKNLKYPEVEEIDLGERTTVYVRFIVQEDGSISNVIIEKGIAPAFDEEALRLVRNMPNWIPREMYGKKVKTYVLLPFSFHFQ